MSGLLPGSLPSAVLNLVTLVLTIAALLACIFAPQIVRYFLAPGFSTDPATFSLTVNLLRIQSFSAVLFGIGGMIISILNAHQIFFIPQITAAMYQLGQIFGVLVLYALDGDLWPGLGSCDRLCNVCADPTAIPVPASWRIYGLARPGKSRCRESLPIDGTGAFSGPPSSSLISGSTTISPSRMEAGSIVSLSYAFTLMVMAQAVIAQSVAIAAMPTFSAQHALGKMDEMRSSSPRHSAACSCLLFRPV